MECEFYFLDFKIQIFRASLKDIECFGDMVLFGFAGT